MINHDQTGFIAGRYIGENTRLTYDIMNYAEENNIPGLLLLIDFEKAFDSVSWKFISNTLKFFNFGISVQNWISTFQCKISSAVNQGGNLSPFFSIGRGCRQGDPIAAYCFILCAEILAIKIRNNKNIKGIKVDEKEILLSQYADDTCLILDGTQKSLKSSLDDLSNFAIISGLKMNYSKTKLIWIGSKKYSDDTLCNEYNLQWGITKFDYLGIEFDVDLHKIVRMNYDKKLVKIKAIIESWKKRVLTPIGKITVIKTLLTSQLNHLFISLPNPNEDFIKKINTLLYQFLWNNKPDKIKRSIITKNYDEGGLRMIDIKNFMISLKSTWLRRLYQDERKWMSLIKCKVDLHKLAHCGDAYLIKCYNNTHNIFWKDVFLSVHKILKLHYTQTEFLKLPLWYNSKVTIGNSVVFYERLYKKNIFIVNDIFNEDKTFKSYDQICDILNFRINFLEYQGLVRKLKSLQRTLTMDQGNINQQHKLSYPYIPANLELFQRNEKGTYPMYDILKNNNDKPTGQRKWNMITLNDEIYTWSKIYRHPFEITKNSKLQWLQYRINHKILVTNKLLFKLGIKDNNLCFFCEREIETVEHLLWHCQKVQDLLLQLKTHLDNRDIMLTLEYFPYMFGSCVFNPTKNVEDIILLNVKQYIYQTKCLKKALNLNSLLATLKQAYNIEYEVAKHNNKLDYFNENWSKWITCS